MPHCRWGHGSAAAMPTSAVAALKAGPCSKAFAQPACQSLLALTPTCSCAIVLAASGRSSSAISIVPASCPSMPTYTRMCPGLLMAAAVAAATDAWLGAAMLLPPPPLLLLPLPAAAARIASCSSRLCSTPGAASAAAAAPAACSSAGRVTHSRVPTDTRRPATEAVTPLPGSCTNEPSSATCCPAPLPLPLPLALLLPLLLPLLPAASAAAAMARAKGCVLPRSTAAASSSSSVGSCAAGPAAVGAPSGRTSTTAGLPAVRVPVLSKTTVSTREAACRAGETCMYQDLTTQPGCGCCSKPLSCLPCAQTRRLVHAQSRAQSTAQGCSLGSRPYTSSKDCYRPSPARPGPAHLQYVPAADQQAAPRARRGAHKHGGGGGQAQGAGAGDDQHVAGHLERQQRGGRGLGAGGGGVGGKHLKARDGRGRECRTQMGVV